MGSGGGTPHALGLQVNTVFGYLVLSELELTLGIRL